MILEWRQDKRGNYMDIGKKLKEWRQKRKLSQMDLSERSGVSQSQISSIESGLKENPGIITMKKLADALEITVEDLIK